MWCFYDFRKGSKSLTISKQIFCILMFTICFPAFGHGKIDLVECYQAKASIRVRVQRTENDKGLQMIFFKKGNQIEKTVNCDKPKIEDLVKGKSIVEKIQLKAEKASLSLEIPEIYAHKIRQGQGELRFEGKKPEVLKNCMLVYQH